ncbi:MAG: hypothetical protein CVV64_12270 [Candidatus Wallbacteria bacterium HGW-Wallbacteria-1]|jgi:hypothetical protein|uniref:M23ase beta-sheet core domain-containing protein n=1 Tax=Candidatus Wallbacteria bacterium HGW-Wallbacteria-1 TaxID=2013854 RepID=A0A2N1PNM7_9BACT|nr:MAG: hypothetical protein CVV64_12270 [Candidatus Wallbacteria bacterium HGW-Wallbacteria-1]
MKSIILLKQNHLISMLTVCFLLCLAVSPVTSQTLGGLDTEAAVSSEADNPEDDNENTVSDSKAEKIVPAEKPVNDGSWTGYVTSRSGVNARKSPWGTVTGRLEYNDEVMVSRSSGEWYEIVSDNGKCFVHSKYIARRMTQQEETVDKVKAFVAATSNFGGRPVKGGRISSPFGYRIHPIQKIKKLHKGIDFAVAGGTPILAMGPGKVIHAGWVNGYGYTVKVLHDNGLVTLYGHLKKGSLKVKVGQKVQSQQSMGAVNNSGASAGNHLHFEVHKNGKPINPASIQGVTL